MPIVIATPASPRPAPIIFWRLIVGCPRPVTIVIASTNIGGVAFSTPASPLAICISPQLIRVKGSALCSMPCTRKAIQTDFPRGSECPCAVAMQIRRIAAIVTRAATIVKGGIVASATLISVNELPQISESSSNSPISNARLVDPGFARAACVLMRFAPKRLA